MAAVGDAQRPPRSAYRLEWQATHRIRAADGPSGRLWARRPAPRWRVTIRAARAVSLGGDHPRAGGRRRGRAIRGPALWLGAAAVYGGRGGAAAALARPVRRGALDDPRETAGTPAAMVSDPGSGRRGSLHLRHRLPHHGTARRGPGPAAGRPRYRTRSLALPHRRIGRDADAVVLHQLWPAGYPGLRSGLFGGLRALLHRRLLGHHGHASGPGRPSPQPGTSARLRSAQRHISLRRLRQTGTSAPFLPLAVQRQRLRLPQHGGATARAPAASRGSYG